MIGHVRRLVGRLVGREPETDADSSERSADESVDDDRVTGSGEPILDEVYGQPGQSRALDRIDEQARELADERGIDLEENTD